MFDCPVRIEAAWKVQLAAVGGTQESFNVPERLSGDPAWKGTYVTARHRAAKHARAIHDDRV